MQNMYFAFQKSGKMRPSRRKKKSFSRTQKNIGDKTGESFIPDGAAARDQHTAGNFNFNGQIC